jgi:hypothetical protein
MRISLVPLRELAPLGESRVDDSAQFARGSLRIALERER